MLTQLRDQEEDQNQSKYADPNCLRVVAGSVRLGGRQTKGRIGPEGPEVNPRAYPYTSLAISAYGSRCCPLKFMLEE